MPKWHLEKELRCTWLRYKHRRIQKHGFENPVQGGLYSRSMRVIECAQVDRPMRRGPEVFDFTIFDIYRPDAHQKIRY